MSRREETILGSKGEPILYCVITKEGSLEASFEYYGGKGGSDLEIIDTIPTSEFPKILRLFSLPDDLFILDAVKEISSSGQGERLKELIRNKTIWGEHFSWMTDRD